ncbi:Hypothetical_protein [Hexamita inflata]|uniref:Hypothetical_protein n=1 Tax=Hexamita inflata TaxID=28002 RepID=A0AA86PX21_9EUKA|nr:Hypothetical protein HINF_LOCUS32933 [Hexamita inflata]
MYGKPNVNKHITGRYILSFTAAPMYRDIILRHYLNYQFSAVKISSKTNFNQASAHQIVPFQPSVDQSNQLTTRRATMLVDHVELFMSQVESAIGQHRSTFMNGDPAISQHPSGKYLIALDLFESYFDEILSKFGDAIYADKQQSQENPQPEVLPIKQAYKEPEVPSQNAIQQESDQKAEAPSQLVNTSENIAAQKQKAEPQTPNREVPVQTSHPVKFHVRNCEETLKAIESALKMPREKFIDGSSYISAGSPGYNLSFLVKSHVYEQVRPLQETLSIQTERKESVVKPEQQTTQLKNSGQKPCTAGTESKLQSLQPEQNNPVKTDQPKFVPVKFHVNDCEETLKSIEQILCVPRERFVHGKLSILARKSGQLLQFFVEPEYLERVQSLQKQLSIDMQVQANQFSGSLTKEQSQISQQAPPVNKESVLQQNTDGNLNKPSEPYPEPKKELQKQLSLKLEQEIVSQNIQQNQKIITEIKVLEQISTFKQNYANITICNIIPFFIRIKSNTEQLKIRIFQWF